MGGRPIGESRMKMKDKAMNQINKNGKEGKLLTLLSDICSVKNTGRMVHTNDNRF